MLALLKAFRQSFFLFVVFLTERLSIAYITNPWAPVKWTTGPHRVTTNYVLVKKKKQRLTT